MGFKRLYVRVVHNNNSGEGNSNSLHNQVRNFSFNELRAATDDFNRKYILGRGGFGVVYKGCLADGSTVAIKRLLKEKSSSEGLLQFHREVEMISMALHKNLLKLYGFCITSKERLLVYPFMANGSVASRLKGGQESQLPLCWRTRKCVAYGTAIALSYLHDHCNPKIIHRDVKADNILLNEEFEAVVGDFGLAKLLNSNESQVTTGVCGTIGHIAPEYFINLRCSKKTDVYGYGILLLELITGKRVYDIIPPSKRDEVTLFDWIRETLQEKRLDLLIDSDLHPSFRNHNFYPEAEVMIDIALQCTQLSPKERPNMSNLVRMLEEHSLVGGSVTKMVFDERLKVVDQEKLLKAFSWLIGEQRQTVHVVTLNHGHTIAIKRLNKEKIHRANNFVQYLDLRGKVEHPNVFGYGAYHKLHGEEFLVYDYLPNGGMNLVPPPLLDQNGLPFGWSRRLHSLKEAAQGLAYIHENLNEAHGNIKPSNVLFDLNKVACIQLEIPYHVSTPSSVYMAPEQSPSKEADVYSFGVLFLGFLTGIDPQSSDFSDLKIKRWNLGYPVPESYMSRCRSQRYLFDEVLSVGLDCLAESPEERPTMGKVIERICWS